MSGELKHRGECFLPLLNSSILTHAISALRLPAANNSCDIILITKTGLTYRRSTSPLTLGVTIPNKTISRSEVDFRSVQSSPIGSPFSFQMVLIKNNPDSVAD